MNLYQYLLRTLLTSLFSSWSDGQCHPVPPSVDIFNLEHSIDLVILFRQNVLALVKISRWLKHARVIDRTNTLKAKLLRKSQPPDVHCEGDDLVGHVNHESTAGLVGIQSGPNKGFGDDVCGASLYNVSYALFVLGKGPLAPLPSVRAKEERQVAQCAARLSLGANPTC